MNSEEIKKENQINRPMMLRTLKHLKSGLSMRSGLYEFTCFYFHDDKITSYNDAICMTVVFPTGISGGVHGSSLLKVLSEMKNKCVSFLQEGDKLIIKDGEDHSELKIECKVDAQYIKEFLSWREQLLGKTDEWEPFPPDLIEGIDSVLFSVSKDMTKGAGTCVFVEDNNIFSSDGARISWFKMENNIGTSFLLPGRSAKDLVKIQKQRQLRTNGTDRYCIIQDGEKYEWIHFAGEGFVFSARLYDDKYPEMLQYFQDLRNDNFIEPIILPEDLESSLADALKIMKRYYNRFLYSDMSIKIKIMEKRLELIWKTKNNEIACEDTFSLLHAVERPFMFSVHPQFLKEAFKRSREMIYYEDKKVVRFSTGNFEHLVAVS